MRSRQGTWECLAWRAGGWGGVALFSCLQGGCSQTGVSFYSPVANDRLRGNGVHLCQGMFRWNWNRLPRKAVKLLLLKRFLHTFASDSLSDLKAPTFDTWMCLKPSGYGTWGHILVVNMVVYMISVKHIFKGHYMHLTGSYFLMSSVFHFSLSKKYLCVQVISVEQILECEVGQVVNQCWLEFFLSMAVRVD